MEVSRKCPKAAPFRLSFMIGSSLLTAANKFCVIIFNMKITNGRLNRKDFAIGFIIFALIKFIGAIPAYVLFFLDSTSQSAAEDADVLFNLTSVYSPTGILFHAFSIIVIIWALQIFVRRFHDIGKSGALSILVLIDFIVGRVVAHSANYLASTNQLSLSSVALFQIPSVFSATTAIMIFYLLIKEGQSAENKYGIVPDGKTSIKSILLNK